MKPELIESVQHIHRAGGFYIDVGASSLISQHLISHKYSPGPNSIATLKSNSIIFGDGEEHGAEIIIFATGYQTDAPAPGKSLATL
jgi:hypothetical protein